MFAILLYDSKGAFIYTHCHSVLERDDRPVLRRDIKAPKHLQGIIIN